MLKVIYHALPIYVWFGCFVSAMIFSMIPMYFLLMWLANTISKCIEKGKEMYDVKRRKKRVSRNNKKNTR